MLARSALGGQALTRDEARRIAANIGKQPEPVALAASRRRGLSKEQSASVVEPRALDAQPYQLRRMRDSRERRDGGSMVFSASVSLNIELKAGYVIDLSEPGQARGENRGGQVIDAKPARNQANRPQPEVTDGNLKGSGSSDALNQ